MSYLVSVQTEVRDLVAIRVACLRLKLAESVFEIVKLFCCQVTGSCMIKTIEIIISPND